MRSIISHRYLIGILFIVVVVVGILILLRDQYIGTHPEITNSRIGLPCKYNNHEIISYGVIQIRENEEVCVDANGTGYFEVK